VIQAEGSQSRGTEQMGMIREVRTRFGGLGGLEAWGPGGLLHLVALEVWRPFAPGGLRGLEALEVWRPWRP
jgi:hypothetical protein